MTKEIKNSSDIARLAKEKEDCPSEAELAKLEVTAEPIAQQVKVTPIDLNLEEMMEMGIEVPSATAAVEQTAICARKNTEKKVRVEAKEILVKAQANIQSAIDSGNYFCEIIGPARAQALESSIDPALVLKKNLREYHPDTVDAVRRFLDKSGYKTEMDGTIGIVIRWG